MSEWAEGVFKPEDLNDIKSRADRIVKDDGTWIEVSMIAPVEGARDFIDRYGQAEEGNIMAMFEMLTFLGSIAESLRQGIEMDAQD